MHGLGSFHGDTRTVFDEEKRNAQVCKFLSDPPLMRQVTKNILYEKVGGI